MRLGPLLTPEHVLVLGPTEQVGEVYEALAHAVADEAGVDPAVLAATLAASDAAGRVANEDSVAFPHARMKSVPNIAAAVALIRGGVPFNAGKHRCDLAFLLIGPLDSGWQHLGMLARIARICHRPGVLTRLREAPDAAALHAALKAEDDRCG